MSDVLARPYDYVTSKGLLREKKQDSVTEFIEIRDEQLIQVGWVTLGKTPRYEDEEPDKKALSTIKAIIKGFAEEVKGRKTVEQEEKLLEEHRTVEANIFIEQNDLAWAYDIALCLLKEHFENLISIQFEVKEDFFDDGIKWIQVEVTAKGNLSELSKTYSKFLDAWLDNVGTTENDLIRFDYSVAD